ncbi:uncharacterized protein LOC113160317 isoform X1 [Anabas testudineus]|uniref:uncharacterized protein LOC113160317 isoform X1 n=1 Tax=Anabas testudineus TaxID=64144 RepID=UPI000E45EC0B|nr:uncharacterized protein LOC113160317 isoform X1 [Anabas testudineus]
MLSTMGSQWLRLVEGCSQMLGEQLCPQSFRPFVERTDRTARQLHRGGRGPLFTAQQEEATCTMVVENNAIRLREIKSTTIEDNNIFANVQTVSISTIDRVLKGHQMKMKQLYTVPFERNGERVMELRYQYVQRMMELEASEQPHSFIYMDEAGFNLTKCRRRGRNIIGHRATVDVPGQRGGNITTGAAICDVVINGVLTHIPIIGPYNTEHLITFLETLYRDLIPEEERGQSGDHLPTYVKVWDNVSFHHSNIIRQWFAAQNRMRMEFISPYSPFLNPIEEFFSAWRWKVYDRQPHTQMTLLAAMDAACDDITADACRGWIRHSKRFFPRCIAREDIRCDVDENLWPNIQERQEV